MGVKELWKFLKPVGRSVDLQTMANRRYAVDASIWITQFVKAMRDAEGNPIKHAHIKGFFQRIIRLLVLNIKPVFVFDGGTPLLKRQTVAARRARRDNSDVKLRRLAEKQITNLLQQSAVASVRQQKALGSGGAAAAAAAAEEVAEGGAGSMINPGSGSSAESGSESESDDDDEMSKALALSMGTASAPAEQPARPTRAKRRRTEAPAAVAGAGGAAGGAAAGGGGEDSDDELALAVQMSLEESQPGATRDDNDDDEDDDNEDEDDEEENEKGDEFDEGTVQHGQQISDRNSVFQGHALACTTPEEAKRFVESIKNDGFYAEADHQISAYRLWKGRWVEGSEDDGEGGGGRRVLTEMQRLDCKNVCVVVSRWWGGTNLGQMRFRHIVNSARAVLEQMGYGEPAAAAAGGQAGEQGQQGDGRKIGRRGRKYFSRDGSSTAGMEAVRPDDIDPALWQKMLLSLRGSRPARRNRAAAAAAADAGSPTGEAGNGSDAAALAFGSGGEVDEETRTILRQLPPETQLKLVREMQKAHERDSHARFIKADQRDNVEGGGRAMDDVSTLQLGAYLQKAALKRREVAALVQLNNASQGSIEIPRALAAAAGSKGALTGAGAWGDGAGGDKFAAGGGAVGGAASKSMQLWDAEGKRISSNRLAGEAEREYVLWKEGEGPDATEHDEAESNNTTRKSQAAAAVESLVASGVDTRLGLRKDVRLIDELSTSMQRAGQRPRQIVDGNLLPSRRRSLSSDSDDEPEPMPKPKPRAQPAPKQEEHVDLTDEAEPAAGASEAPRQLSSSSSEEDDELDGIEFVSVPLPEAKEDDEDTPERDRQVEQPAAAGGHEKKAGPAEVISVLDSDDEGTDKRAAVQEEDSSSEDEEAEMARAIAMSLAEGPHGLNAPAKPAEPEQPQERDEPPVERSKSPEAPMEQREESPVESRSESSEAPVEASVGAETERMGAGGFILGSSDESEAEETAIDAPETADEDDRAAEAAARQDYKAAPDPANEDASDDKHEDPTVDDGDEDDEAQIEAKKPPVDQDEELAKAIEMSLEEGQKPAAAVSEEESPSAEEEEPDRRLTDGDEELARSLDAEQAQQAAAAAKPAQPAGAAAVDLTDEVAAVDAAADALNEAAARGTAGLDELSADLQEEAASLQAQQRRTRRDADGGIDASMLDEIKDLLELCGIPFVTAPMEAEAQCAALEELGLVDGVISDDGDTFLFGARHVFKNIFDTTGAGVQTYWMDDIETELNCDRKRCVHLAHLLGSDYTTGVVGIGPVNAVEVLAAYPDDAALRKFRDWARTVGNDPRPPSAPECDSDQEEEEDIAAARLRHRQLEFQYKHRNAKKHYMFEDGFPRPAVTNAYLEPEVNRDPQPFSWKEIRYDDLAEWCERTAGWDREETKKRLKPAMDAAESRATAGTQQRLHQYFEPARRVATIQSVRMAKAVKNMASPSRSDSRNTSGGAASSNGDGNSNGAGRGRKHNPAVASDRRVQNDVALDAAAAEKIANAPKPNERKRAAPKAKAKSSKRAKAGADADGKQKKKRGRSAYLIFMAEEGRETAKAAAPDAGPQDIMRLGAAQWSKMTAQEKAPWERRAKEEKTAMAKAAREEEKNARGREREAELRGRLRLLGEEAVAELMGELWPDDEEENASLVGGLHLAPAAGANMLPAPSWAAGGAGAGAAAGAAAAPRAGGAAKKKKRRAATAIDLF